ncbi:SDR family NAD(P)-dependent oxidoreductase [Chelativorans sp. M5D2P16]|uniref:SDR family NAD(P)-dependent oxidoreductase n=1 Tax=Chelativorans sp. M5D2P16 TaxID=3095678 RepID=UPI002ACA8FC3|nr:SDR family oxidoreductase [Chelativorans sp. M5D2P16]MDZ5695931.1 SDR family oxidoreductase [Chelativorans sp. M5D2P16]
MPSNPFALTPGFRAVVIGGAGGIGTAIVRLFLDLGAEVSATGVSEDETTRLALDAHPHLSCECLDVTDDEAVCRYANRFDTIDALVNCAGILRRDEEYDRETFRKVIEVNLTGTFSTCLAFRAALAARKGAVINIASMNAFTALPRIPAYCASKAGVVMLTKSLAHAWAAEGIRVNAVAPGYIETAINAEGRKDRVLYERIAERTALKRWGQPEDLAGTVAYLAMPASSYVTGSVFAVDGGYLAG